MSGFLPICSKAFSSAGRRSSLVFRFKGTTAIFLLNVYTTSPALYSTGSLTVLAASHYFTFSLCLRSLKKNRSAWYSYTALLATQELNLRGRLSMLKFSTLHFLMSSIDTLGSYSLALLRAGSSLHLSSFRAAYMIACWFSLDASADCYWWYYY